MAIAMMPCGRVAVLPFARLHCLWTDGGKGGWWRRLRGAGNLELGARDVSSSGGSRPTDGPCMWRREERG